MKIQSLKIAFFSPTGTTKAVVKGIAKGIGLPSELLDITKPDARLRALRTTKNEALIVAVPVYMGRVPALLGKWLNAIEADNTPAICVVVYGNRAYENALLELKDILIKRGCKPIAGAAYIGEHSFSSPELPTAEGRPDKNDLKQAEKFGREIYKKLKGIKFESISEFVNVPGENPYGGITELWDVDFIAVGKDCKQCGICADACPMGAIDTENSGLIDKVKCISCCACIKICPQNARIMKEGPVMDAAIRLNTLYSERREPVYFI